MPFAETERNKPLAAETRVDSNLEIFESGRSNAMLRVVVSLILLVFIGVVVRSYVTGAALGPGLLTGPLLVTVLTLLWRHRTRTAIVVFVWGIVVVGTANAVVVAGMYTPVLVIFPLLCLLAGMMFSSRSAWLLLLIVCSLLGIIARLQETTTTIISSANLREPLVVWIVYSMVCTIGTVLGIYIIANIRERYQRSVRLSNELKGLLDSATEVAIVSMDLQGLVLLFNPGAERLLGYSAEEMLGKSVQIYLGGEMNAIAKDAGKVLGHTVAASPREIIAAIVDLGGITRNSTYHCKDGRKVRVSVVTNLVRDARGVATGLLSIARDITDQLNAEADLLKLTLQLENRVNERTTELSQAMDRLKQTQEDLIQSEKLASLGSMVAGVSHELNTPIGNAVTVASTLIDQAKKLDADFQAGTLKRSELASGLGGIVGMSELIERSVQRAATLIASFKQVAIDQTSERRREFDLHDVVEDVICSLRPGLKTKPWQIENAVPAGISCDSFPGPLEQILTNLIQNAVLHAFPDRESGTVTVTAAAENERLNLNVIDDGIGMDTVTATGVLKVS